MSFRHEQFAITTELSKLLWKKTGKTSTALNAVGIRALQLLHVQPLPTYRRALYCHMQLTASLTRDQSWYPHVAKEFFLMSQFCGPDAAEVQDPGWHLAAHFIILAKLLELSCRWLLMLSTPPPPPPAQSITDGLTIPLATLAMCLTPYFPVYCVFE